MGNVYIAISPSNKKYVGATSQSTKERWKEHCQRAREGRKGAIYNAIRKYGSESFLLFTLFESNNWSEIIEKEVEFISENNTMYPFGYNLTIGGEGTPGRKVTEEARKRMSEGQKKRFQNEEQKKLVIENGKKGNKISSEKWAKIREEKKKEKQLYYSSPEYKKMVSDRIKEYMKRPEVKAKVVEAARKRAANPEWRKKVSESKKGQGLGSKRSEEQKKKLSDARKLWWAKKKGLVNN